MKGELLTRSMHQMLVYGDFLAFIRVLICRSNKAGNVSLFEHNEVNSAGRDIRSKTDNIFKAY